MSGARTPVRISRWCGGLVAAVALLGGNLAFAATRPGLPPTAVNPIGVHSMLQLNDPYSFMQAMFAEAAGLHASAIRLDVAPALVFTAPSAPPDFSGLDEVTALSQQYHLRVIADLLTIPWWIADCQTPADLSDMARCGTDDLVAYGSLITQIVTPPTLSFAIGRSGTSPITDSSSPVRRRSTRRC